MSHEATAWAFRQRGLKPAAWRVLVNLADHHNRHTGRCDPSQETLAEECEMSRSTLNLHLDALEERGLIRREARWNPRTRRQERTSYILGFDFARPQEPSPETGHGVAGTEAERAAPAGVAAAAEPCPETGRGPCPKNRESRVRNSDRNLGREPGILNPPLPPVGAASRPAGGTAGERDRAEVDAGSGARAGEAGRPRRRRDVQTGTLAGVAAILRSRWGMADADAIH